MNWWKEWYVTTKRRFAKKTWGSWAYYKRIEKIIPPITREDIIGSEVYIKSRNLEKKYLDRYKQ